MRPYTIALTVLLCLAATALPAGGSDAPDLPKFTDSIQVVGDTPLLFPIAPAEPISIRFGIGELEIVAADVSEVRAELHVACKDLPESRCAAYRERLRIEARRTDQGTEVVLVGLSKWKLRRVDLEGLITVPRDSPLTAEIGIGEVDIFAGSEDLEVHMGIGDLTVRVPESSVGSVAVVTRIGDASLTGNVHHAGHRRKLLGAALDWSAGPGDARVEVGLRIGDAKVVLE